MWVCDMVGYHPYYPHREASPLLKKPDFRIFKRDLFATTFAFGAQAVIRFGGSLILTRILYPDAYGVLAILMSLVFVIEMLADIGVYPFIIRDKDAEEPAVRDTAWTLRLCRATINSAIVFLSAPALASLYGAATLVAPLRVISLWFILAALESMSFPIAIRQKRARIVMYSEMSATLVATVCTVIYSFFSKNYWGMVAGTLVNRGFLSLLSYCLFRDMRPKLHFDMTVARRIFDTTKFTMPSSVLTLVLSQFDKIVFLRLFDLHLLGLYGLASNIASPVEALVSRISQNVLYPRSASNFRTRHDTFVEKYYTENVKLFVSILGPPAAICGAASFIISLLYPATYSQAGMILYALMFRVVLISFASPAEDLLIATGRFRVILIGNVLRVVWMASASFTGYYLFGFMGFTYGIASSVAPALAYYWWLQRKHGMLIIRYELYKVAFAVGTFVAAYAATKLAVMLWTSVAPHLPWMTRHPIA